MLTLGLMEGTIAFAAMVLLFSGAANGRTRLHLVLGVPATILVGLVAYQIHSVSAASGVSEVLGLLMVATIAFAVPIIGMWVGWRMLHATSVEAPVTSAPRVEERTAAVVSLPLGSLEHRRAHRDHIAHRHAA